MQQVFLSDEDITKFIAEIPPVIQSAGDYGQLLFNDLPSLNGDNRKGFWDTNNQASPFFGYTSLSNYKITIINDGQITFEGTILNIIADNYSKTSEVVLKSKIQTALEKGIIYKSLDQDTPANIAKEICDLYKIPINSISFGRSNAIYNADNIYVSAFFKGETDIQTAIQNIAEIGVARVYIVNNELYFDVFRERSATAVFTASDKEDNPNGVTLFSNPQIEIVEKQETQGYRIEWIGSPGAVGITTLGSESEQGKSISASMDSPVRIMTLQSAVWVGETWVDYLNAPQRRITFDIPINYGKSLSINDPILLEYKTNESVTLDIIAIDNSTKVTSKITGLTR